jgi:hypothetical protein
VSCYGTTFGTTSEDITMRDYDGMTPAELIECGHAQSCCPRIFNGQLLLTNPTEAYLNAVQNRVGVLM